MLIERLVFLNLWRNKGRSLLTLVGLTVAILAFGLLSTVVEAWYAGAKNASQARLITRSSVSLIFPLPKSYQERIRGVDGVEKVTYSRWFGGVFRDNRGFFPQFAVDTGSYFEIYPEFKMSDEVRDRFYRDRRSAIVGRRLANEYGFKAGDIINLKGTLFPGDWQFLIAGVFDGADEKTDTRQMYFHWDYLNEESKRRPLSREPDSVGVFVSSIANPGRVADVSIAIDALFANSPKETLTETEQAFQMGFVSMTEAIVLAIRAVSFVVVLIIMAVMANTMAMAARERTSEYATLKALGFSSGFVSSLIASEALLLAVLGGGLAIALTFPVAEVFHTSVGSMFKIFEVSLQTNLLQVLAALFTGLVAALAPAYKAYRVQIVEGLRAI